MVDQVFYLATTDWSHQSGFYTDYKIHEVDVEIDTEEVYTSHKYDVETWKVVRAPAESGLRVGTDIKSHSHRTFEEAQTMGRYLLRRTADKIATIRRLLDESGKCDA